MAGKHTFFDNVNLVLAGFFLCVFVIVMCALLVDSLLQGYPAVKEEIIAENIVPVGKVYYRK